MDQHVNFGISAVATAPSPATTGTTLTVTTGHGSRFPLAPFNAVVCPATSDPTPANAEIVRVTGIATDTLTITRAQESSTARTIGVGDRIFSAATKKTFTDIEDAILPASGSAYEHTLASSASVGATTITLAAAPAFTVGTFYVAIDIGTVGCEIRYVSGISGAVLTLAAGNNATPGTTALLNAHSSGARVRIFTGDSVPAQWFGVRGNNSTDDEPGIQQGLVEAQRNGLWLDGGGGRQSVIGLPLLLPPTVRWRSHTVKCVGGTYEANNAALMNYQGKDITFTALASTNAFTNTGTNAIASTDEGIVFKGASLPAPIVAGKVYYPVAGFSSTVFQVSTTRGGAAVDLTTDGSGTAYTEVLSLQKVELQDIYVKGNAVCTNGAALNLQQQSTIRGLRVDSATVAGLVLAGQQAEFKDTVLLSCPTGLALEWAQFMHFDGFDVEGSNCVRAVHSRATNIVFASNSGALDCEFRGVHFENSDTNAIGFDLEGQSRGIFINGGVCSYNTGAKTFIKCHTGDISSSGYAWDGIWFSAATDGAPTILNDTDRGHTDLAIVANAKFRRYFSGRVPIGSSGSFAGAYAEEGEKLYRPGGGYIARGGQQNAAPSMESRPGSAQTGPQALYKDASGNDGLAILPSTVVEMLEQADPSAPAANKARLYTRDNGSGKTQICVRFPTGAVQVLATEP